MPYLVGVGGSGKSLVLKVVSAMFRRSNAVGNLAARREEVFGLDNIARKEVVMGRDMPAKLSGVIAQEMMQCRTTGGRYGDRHQGQALRELDVVGAGHHGQQPHARLRARVGVRARHHSPQTNRTNIGNAVLGDFGMEREKAGVFRAVMQSAMHAKCSRYTAIVSPRTPYLRLHG